MVKVVALLILACCGPADATLGDFLKNSMPGQSTETVSWAGLCQSMGKVYQGYGYEIGGGSVKIDVTCSGSKTTVVCLADGYTFTKCTSASADGDSEGGCTCAKDHPKCWSDGWCYKGNSFSQVHCPGSCTADATTGCECPAAFPTCTQKYCFNAQNSWTSQCQGECSAHAPPPPVAPPAAPASGCTCSDDYPFCYTANQWCYKSATSNDYDKTCSVFDITQGALQGTCTASAPAPSGSAPAPALSGGSGDQTVTLGSCSGTQDAFTQSEAEEMLDLHNKFRCAVGTPPIQWNGPLQCQAQKTQDAIAAFQHSSSYSKPISAGENLATGTSPSMAAWMWFTEYTENSGQSSSQADHYTAMNWAATTEVGCGIQRSGGGVIRCQYAAAPPNFGGDSDFVANVPLFTGEVAKFTKCGLTIAEVKQHVQQFQGWGILNSDPALTATLGLFAESDDEHVAWMSTSSNAVTAGAVFAIAALAAVGVVAAMRRRSQHDALLVPGDEEDAVEMQEAGGVE